MNPRFDESSPGDDRRALINHRQVEAFRAVMISGTTTGAAVLLHSSQPVISKLISRLQTTSGIKLFELRKNRLVPTPEAKILFNTIERSYIGLEHISDTIAELRGAHAGRVLVGSMPSFGMGVMPHLMHQFLLAHPAIQVNLETVNSSLIKENVVSGKLDVGISLDGIDTSGVSAVPLLTVDTICVMSSSHPLASKDRITVQDLHQQRFIAPGLDSALRVSFDRLLDRYRVRPVVVAETTYAMTTCILAMHGVGAALASPFVVPDLLRQGFLVKPFEPVVPIRLLLLTSLDYPPSKVCKLFVSSLKQSLKAFAATFPIPMNLHV